MFIQMVLFYPVQRTTNHEMLYEKIGRLGVNISFKEICSNLSLRGRIKSKNSFIDNFVNAFLGNNFSRDLCINNDDHFRQHSCQINW
mmetsp:Transcript_2945/g.4047  ORF Transcript_2945/g.4047 Transcript_2945/m.4047 type:complete len:87 (+) Transcript_2945:1555-1815(+)